MTFSYTQLAGYLACPLRYRYRYLDGWQEKETRAGLLFGRAFEQALAALFRREDPGCALFEAWSQYKNSPLEYPKSETWDQMLEQGIHLLTRFVQDDRVQIRNPRRNLQIKFTRPIGNGNEFVAYVDAIGQLDGERSVIDWKTTGARYPDQPEGSAGSGSPTRLLFLDHRGTQRGLCSLRAQTAGRGSVSARNHHPGAARPLRGR